MKLHLFTIFFIKALLLQAFDNPFEIEFPEKVDLTTEDYIEVQDKLREREKDIDSILHQVYPTHLKKHTTYHDYWIRCGRGLRQVVIDVDKGYFPRKELVKIGKGGNNCIVCCVPFETPNENNNPSIRKQLLLDIPNALKKVGFNGYFLQMTGGYPNPSGIEMRYAGVPYAFKIFMMLEAVKLGFSNVLWIDAACLPIRNPSALFRVMERHGAVFYSFPIRPPNTSSNYIPPITHSLLEDLTGTNILSNSEHYVCTIVFGLKMDSPAAELIVEEYYNMVELGWPFVSCFPEEFVLTAILGKASLRPLHYCRFYDHLFTRAGRKEKDTLHRIKNAKSKGYFFYHRKH